MTCKSCQNGFDHCHGTLVRHGDGGTDCATTNCTDFDPARHALTIECRSIEGGCGCVSWLGTYAVPESARAS